MSDWADILDDDERSHSRFAPSALKRILACPRSVALSEAIASQSTWAGASRRGSVYAAEGSVAHSVAEEYLRGTGATRALDPGNEVEHEGHKIIIDEAMHDHGDEYAVYVRALMSPDSTLYVESTVNLDAIVGEGANMYGHLDSAVWTPSTGILDVCDYKYGRGIKVSPLDNPQLKAYGLGALTSLPEIDPDEVRAVRIHVFQPRVPGVAIPDVIPTVDLLMWGLDEVAPVIASILADGALDREYVSGDHCRFCPALSQCPAIRARAVKSAQKAFGASPLPASTLSDDEIAEVLDEADVVGPWLEAVKTEGVQRAEAGRAIQGRKLVAARGRRVWAPGVTPRDVGYATQLSPSQLTETVMLSPAQVEKKTNLAWHPKLKPLVHHRSSGHTLAKTNDPRPAVSTGKGAAVFVEVEE